MRFLLAIFLAFIATAFASDCNTQCLDNYEPVCASNGMTFSNECILRREACLAKLSLTVAKQGACPSFCPQMCTENYEPVCATNGKTFSNYCNLLREVCTSTSLSQEGVAVAHLGACSPAPVPCPEMCPMLYQPVCGSNKLTYSNLCMLERDACLTKASITVSHQGECSNDDAAPAAPTTCPEMCIEVYSPVCASNGRTFSNECFLQREACLSKSTLTVAHQGACELSCPDMCVETYEPVCASNGVTYSNFCELVRAACTLGASPSALSVSSEGPCAPISSCPKGCTKEYHPVCGTDGKTYSNPCMLALTACETKAGVTVAYEGPCRLPCPDMCTAQYSPVCGSNGRTYANPCLLSKEACLLKTEISILHQGECVEADCPQMCTKDYRPLCGSDGKTYGNLCSLNREACLAKTPLTVASQGECAEPCPQVCPLIYAPVCGSNWKTYSNECNLKAEACNLKTEITVRATTECESVGCTMRCSKELIPVCGSDGLTYGNECMLLLSSCEKRRSISKLHDGQCVAADCTMQCAQIYEPLCGTDRKTYSSLCHYDSANCNSLQSQTQQSIGVAHQGECAQLAEDAPITWDVLREFDANNDNVISFDEYLALAAIVYPYASEKLNRKVFDALDANKDGVLDSEESRELNSAGIHSQGNQKGGNTALAVSATVLGLVVVAVVIAAVVIVRKRKSAASFAYLDEQEESPYNPMSQ